MENTTAMTITTMPVQTKEKLTSDSKSRLIKIIEQEFVNKESLYHQVAKQEEEKVLDEYKKKVGFAKIAKKLRDIEIAKLKLNKEAEGAIAELNKVGLDSDGEPRSNTSQRYINGIYVSRLDYEAKELNDLLSTIKNNSPTETLKNKIVTRLTLATTVGEATVIMREVLGNGLIPSLKEV